MYYYDIIRTFQFSIRDTSHTPVIIFQGCSNQFNQFNQQPSLRVFLQARSLVWRFTSLARRISPPEVLRMSRTAQDPYGHEIVGVYITPGSMVYDTLIIYNYIVFLDIYSGFINQLITCGPHVVGMGEERPKSSEILNLDPVISGEWNEKRS